MIFMRVFKMTNTDQYSAVSFRLPKSFSSLNIVYKAEKMRLVRGPCLSVGPNVRL
jgi:hypothetical protein